MKLSLAVIYIPIWLDLLLYRLYKRLYEKKNLHSNMVRFIMRRELNEFGTFDIFTFQYG